MPLSTAYLWSKAPAIRLLISLIVGVILQWQFQFPFSFLVGSFIVCFTSIVVYCFLSLKIKFRLTVANGILISLLIAIVGAGLVWVNNVRNHQQWIGHNYKDSNYIVVTLQEPLVEKPNSFKALAKVESVYGNDKFKSTEGQVIVYFKKDSSVKQLHYGSQIIFNKPLQEIKNAGNPGSFDYKRYCLFQGITHQINLSKNDFIILGRENKKAFQQFILNCRSWAVSTLQKFIHGEKEQGLAEALLIGYKDDLDKNLVQSYTNTGVVHIIAISGMHLALIYGLLVLFTKLLKRNKQLNWLRILIILSGLWLFSILAGAQASVIRSAVMFTCIACGELLSKRTSVYNTMALSAFLLLCYDPFWLWDVGFQLSYAAVLSIIIFFRSIYNWIYFQNKLLDAIWKTMAVSIAAQILTTPVSLFHFHQFPLLFLLTNVVVVPLSSLVLFGEIALCVFSFIQPFAKLIGAVVSWMIWFMNTYIERIENISFSLLDGFSITIWQTIFLILAIAFISHWLLEKRKHSLYLAIIVVILFISLRSMSFWQAYTQRKIIVYNVPKHLAIDLIAGRTYHFIGDPDLLFDDFTRNFHLQPSRVLHRIQQQQTISLSSKEFTFCSRKIFIMDSTVRFQPGAEKQKVDFLILSKNPKIYISNLVKTFSINTVVIDGSVPSWKAKLWRKDCDSLKIPCYIVSEQGAFVMNL